MSEWETGRFGCPRGDHDDSSTRRVLGDDASFVTVEAIVADHVEAAVAENDRAKKQALRRLGETGGVPETVGKGLLDAFVNLEDTTSARARRERMERVAEEE